MNADKLTKPVPGDHWINGLLLDGKDFEVPANFSNGFPGFSQKECIGAIPSTDKGRSNLIILLVKISSPRKSSLIFSLPIRVN